VPDIDRLLQDLVAIEEKAQPADIARLLPALEHASARLWLVALRAYTANLGAGSAAQESGLLTVKQVAGLLQYSRGHVYELVRSGQLRGVRHGRTIRFSREALAAWQMDNQAGYVDDHHRSSGESTAYDRPGAHHDLPTARPDRVSARRRAR
jgi:excisionase family DNA binding protein